MNYTCHFSFSIRHSILIAVAPIASLKIGSTLNPKNIKEGSDVYFECNVRANPRSYKLTWFHEVGATSIVSSFFFFDSKPLICVLCRKSNV